MGKLSVMKQVMRKSRRGSCLAHCSSREVKESWLMMPQAKEFMLLLFQPSLKDLTLTGLRQTQLCWQRGKN